jgi:hypothetical protein
MAYSTASAHPAAHTRLLSRRNCEDTVHLHNFCRIHSPIVLHTEPVLFPSLRRLSIARLEATGGKFELPIDMLDTRDSAG